MAQYLTVSAGKDASSATPIFATSDRSVIEAALVALVDRLAPQPAEPARTPDEASP